LIWKSVFILMQIKLIFTRKVVLLSRVILKVRVFGTRKWPITHEAFRLSPSDWLKFIAWFVIPSRGVEISAGAESYDFV